MNLLDRPTRRRIGALQRRAHAFHRFAHHPLCGAYAGEVLHVGKKTRLCKGCVMGFGGLLVGGLTALATHVPGTFLDAATKAPGTFLDVATKAPGTFLAVALLVPAMLVALSRRRLPKLVTRAIPAFLLGLLAARMLQEPSWIGFTGLAAVGVTFVVYRRRGPQRSPCATCPERPLERVCSGFMPVDRAERAFVRMSHRLIDQRAGMA